MKVFNNFLWQLMFCILGIFILLVIMVHIPKLWKLLIGGILFIMVILEILKLILWFSFKEKRKKTGTVSPSQFPHISIHLAIYNEPPELVIKTIKALLLQEYPNFEIVVVDNNTKDKVIWVPVREFCKSLPNVRFFHLKNWPFYKSGALNFSRKVTNPEAKFIFVVDADYILCTDALRKAALNIESESIALVQFPQAYHCNEKKYLPIVEEFDHFFDYYCFKANSCYGALATGTLSLIRLKALDAVGGWPTNSITEDAELGVRLQAAGFDIKYVHQVIGKGIVPIRQHDFIQQRRRWIFGNIQTLLRFSLNPLKNFSKWISGVSQLTAWINLLGLPIIGLVCSLIAFPFLRSVDFIDITILCYSALWLFVISKGWQFFLVDSSRPKNVIKAFLLHFAIMDIAAFHWWPVLLGRKRPFVKTDKSGTGSNYRINLFYPLLHGSLFAIFSVLSNWLAISAFIFIILHSIAIIIDFQCRADGWKNVSYNFKFQL